MKVIIRSTTGAQTALHTDDVAHYTGDAAERLLEPTERTAIAIPSVFVIDVDRRQWSELHNATGNEAPAINGVWVTWSYGDGGGPVIVELHADELSALRSAVAGNAMHVHCLPLGTDLGESLAIAEGRRRAPKVAEAGGPSKWDPKGLRERLCKQQTYAPEQATRAQIGQLIDCLDRHRPLGADGKHDDRHTATCGCD